MAATTATISRRTNRCSSTSAVVLSAPRAAQHSDFQNCRELKNINTWKPQFRSLLPPEHASSDARTLQLGLIKHGFLGDLFLSNTVVNQYARSGKLQEARRMFDGMPQRNVVSWTCLISGYAHWEQPEEACRLFKSMVSAGFSPSRYTFGSVLGGCRESGPSGFFLGAQIHGVILKSGYSRDSLAFNALISMYGRCSADSIGSAHRTFEDSPKGNLETWNSIISVYSRKGETAAAYHLFEEMRRRNLKPDEHNLGSLISIVYTLPSINASSLISLLDQLLSLVLKSGFIDDLYVGSALVSAFSRLGVLSTANKIFSQMPTKNAISMNGLMVGLVKQKRAEEAVLNFREAKGPGMVNADTFVVLLSACADFSSPSSGEKIGKQIHGFVTRNGLGQREVSIGNGLVNMYAKCSAIDQARRVFDLMEFKDQVTWNSLISGLDQNERFEEALTSFKLMRRDDVAPSNFTLISALSSSSSLRFLRLGQHLHCDGVKLRLNLDISVSNALLTMYGDCGLISESQRVFWSTPDHDLVSWNSMISVLANSNAHLPHCMTIFKEMMIEGWHPNKVTFINIFAAASSLSTINDGRQVHALVVKHGLTEEVAVENAMIFFYARSGWISASEELFGAMLDRRDYLSWNSMVNGYVENGLLDKAVDLVWLMASKSQKPDNFTFATVLSGCTAAGVLERGAEMHGFMIRSETASDIVTESALVDMYAKCGKLAYAGKMFDGMQEKNNYTWNSMISGYARHGDARNALRLFQEMKMSLQRPDDVTFIGVLSACSHGGLVEEGLEHFHSMVGCYGIEPRMEHYSCVVDLLGRDGRIAEMEIFIRKMPLKPNPLVWRTVLSACCRTKESSRFQLGSLAGEKLIELEPENPVNYVLLSKLYASMERWEDVARTRISMRAATTARKEAGCSWITFKDEVHTFVAGDTSHENSGDLMSLIQKTKTVGYEPQTGSAFYDVDLEEKERLLIYHSEKLALAFAVSRSSSLPIRIMKNLRVCSDCHLFFRCSSKVIGREIILRDSIRFHHFNDGKCSCGDYW